jgi:hypothetical protein
LATPNYSYEKRQRELAKKRKKEEKAQRKATKTGEGGGEPVDVPSDDATARPAGTPPDTSAG